MKFFWLCFLICNFLPLMAQKDCSFGIFLKGKVLEADTNMTIEITNHWKESGFDFWPSWANDKDISKKVDKNQIKLREVYKNQIKSILILNRLDKTLYHSYYFFEEKINENSKNKTIKNTFKMKQIIVMGFLICQAQNGIKDCSAKTDKAITICKNEVALLKSKKSQLSKEEQDVTSKRIQGISVLVSKLNCYNSQLQEALSKFQSSTEEFESDLLLLKQTNIGGSLNLKQRYSVISDLTEDKIDKIFRIFIGIK